MTHWAFDCYLDHWFHLKKLFCVFVLSESIETIVETIQLFPKDKTCIGFSRANPQYGFNYLSE